MRTRGSKSKLTPKAAAAARLIEERRKRREERKVKTERNRKRMTLARGAKRRTAEKEDMSTGDSTKEEEIKDIDSSNEDTKMAATVPSVDTSGEDVGGENENSPSLSSDEGSVGKESDTLQQVTSDVAQVDKIDSTSSAAVDTGHSKQDEAEEVDGVHNDDDEKVHGDETDKADIKMVDELDEKTKDKLDDTADETVHHDKTEQDKTETEKADQDKTETGKADTDEGDQDKAETEKADEDKADAEKANEDKADTEMTDETDKDEAQDTKVDAKTGDDKSEVKPDDDKSNGEPDTKPDGKPNDDKAAIDKADTVKAAINKADTDKADTDKATDDDNAKDDKVDTDDKDKTDKSDSNETTSSTRDAATAVDEKENETSMPLMPSKPSVAETATTTTSSTVAAAPVSMPYQSTRAEWELNCWRTRYLEVLDFVLDHEVWPEPHTCNHLAEWLRVQRLCWKRHELSRKQIDLLAMIGFPFSSVISLADSPPLVPGKEEHEDSDSSDESDSDDDDDDAGKKRKANKKTSDESSRDADKGESNKVNDKDKKEDENNDTTKDSSEKKEGADVKEGAGKNDTTDSAGNDKDNADAEKSPYDQARLQELLNEIVVLDVSSQPEQKATAKGTTGLPSTGSERVGPGPSPVAKDKQKEPTPPSSSEMERPLQYALQRRRKSQRTMLGTDWVDYYDDLVEHISKHGTWPTKRKLKDDKDYDPNDDDEDFIDLHGWLEKKETFEPHHIAMLELLNFRSYDSNPIRHPPQTPNPEGLNILLDHLGKGAPRRRRRIRKPQPESDSDSSSNSDDDSTAADQKIRLENKKVFDTSDVERNKWKDSFLDLALYVKKNSAWPKEGGTAAPNDTAIAEDDGKHLSLWMEEQRTNVDKLRSDQVELLDLLDFCWNDEGDTPPRTPTSVDEACIAELLLPGCTTKDGGAGSKDDHQNRVVIIGKPDMKGTQRSSRKGPGGNTNVRYGAGSKQDPPRKFVHDLRGGLEKANTSVGTEALSVSSEGQPKPKRVYDVRWDALMGDVAVYLEDHGAWPTITNKKTLSVWLSRQRYARLSGRLTEDRIAQLNRLGFSWQGQFNDYQPNMEVVKALAAKRRATLRAERPEESQEEIQDSKPEEDKLPPVPDAAQKKRGRGRPRKERPRITIKRKPGRPNKYPSQEAIESTDQGSGGDDEDDTDSDSDSDEKNSSLLALKGWKSVGERQWHKYYERLLRYVGKHKSWPVTTLDKNLQRWCVTQRRNKNHRMISSEQVRQLELLKFPWKGYLASATPPTTRELRAAWKLKDEIDERTAPEEPKELPKRKSLSAEGPSKREYIAMWHTANSCNTYIRQVLFVVVWTCPIFRHG